MPHRRDAGNAEDTTRGGGACQRGDVRCCLDVPAWRRHDVSVVRDAKAPFSDGGTHAGPYAQHCGRRRRRPGWLRSRRWVLLPHANGQVHRWVRAEGSDVLRDPPDGDAGLALSICDRACCGCRFGSGSCLALMLLVSSSFAATSNLPVLCARPPCCLCSGPLLPIAGCGSSKAHVRSHRWRCLAAHWQSASGARPSHWGHRHAGGRRTPMRDLAAEVRPRR